MPPLLLLVLRFLVIAVVAVCLAPPPLAEAAARACQNGPRFVNPTYPMSQAVLPVLHNMEYNATVCSWTFTQHELSYANFVPCWHQGRMQVHTCPRHCLRSVHGSPAARVFGSFPYHSSSSICLAALHSGIIADEDGGGVIFDRFLPADWSSSDTQSIFPHGSNGSSYSNGVQAEAVPSSWHPLPSPLTSFSWTVRGPGVVASQRQTAPFSPRSGHLHLQFDGGLDLDHWRHHLILGGRNATHYFNDVHWFQAYTPYNSVHWPNAEGGRWWTLPPAPFSPRSDLRYKWSLTQPQAWNMLNGSALPTAQRADLQIFYIIGGQTGHACGQHLLGVCNNEVWQLNVSRSMLSLSPSNLTFTWSSAPVAVLPFTARCDPAIIHDDRLITSAQHALLGIAGGQLSYDVDAAKCSAPILTTNETWYASTSNLSHWQRGRDTPFSARRSMQEDASFLQIDEIIDAVSPIKRNQLDKSTALVGGIRYTNHTFDAETGRAVMTQAELFADAWACTFPTPGYVHYLGPLLECDWHHSFPVGDTARGPPFEPVGSMPIPVAHGASVGYPDGTLYWRRVRFGGVTSREALRAWANARPVGAADQFRPVDWRLMPANLSLLHQPLLVPNVSSQPDLAKYLRHHLPMSSIIAAAELNDPTSSFALGSDAVIAHTLLPRANKLNPHSTSVHQQAGQMAQTAEGGRWWLPQAGSSVNTTRSSFDFRIGRLGQSSGSIWNAGILAGGHSGSEYSNDWITVQAQRCLWPDDPAYRPLLGMGHSVGEWTLDASEMMIVVTAGGERIVRMPEELPVFSPGDRGHFACDAGFHFEPPLEDDSVTLTCQESGLWLDAALGSIRRCVRNRLRCYLPYVDAGYSQCVDPLPTVRDMTVYVSDLHFRYSAYHERTAEVSKVPITSAALFHTNELVIAGQFFSDPVQVSILAGANGAFDCFPAQVQDLRRWCTDGSHGDDGQLDSAAADCRDFGSLITCALPIWARVINMSVTLRAGRRQRVINTITPAEIQPPPVFNILRRPLLVSAEEPFITVLESDSCRHPEDDPRGLQLIDCPIVGPFVIRLCVLFSPQQFFASWVAYNHDPLSCDGFHAENSDRNRGQPCDDRMPDWNCALVVTCGTCRIPQMMERTHGIRVTSNFGQHNLEQAAHPYAAPTLTVAGCPPGTWTDYLSTNMSTLCLPCEPGHSTSNQSSVQQCTPCPRGQYAREPRSASCLPCPAGQYAPVSGMTSCIQCGLNSWQREIGSGGCSECGSGTYRVPALRSANESTQGDATPRCENCPLGARCFPNGSIVATSGHYLLIQPEGSVAAVPCPAAACADSSVCDSCQLALASFLVNMSSPDFDPSLPITNHSVQGVQWIDASDLAVINSCGPNRRPAVDSEGGVNLLCSDCLPGFSEMGGSCVQCDSTHWDRIVAVLCCCLLLLYLLHRLGLHRSSTSTLAIAVYYAQMSALFLASESLWPYWLSLINVDLDGSGVGAFCLTPMGAYGKIAARLLSPAVAIALLLLLFGTQLLIRACICYGANSRWSACRRLSHLNVVRVYNCLLPAAHELPEHASRPARLLRPQPLSASLQEPLMPSGALELKPPLAVQMQPPLDVIAEEVKQQPPPPLLRRWEETGEEDVVLPAARALLPASGDSVRGAWQHYRSTLLRVCLFSYNTLTTASLSCLHSRTLGQFGPRLYLYPSIDMRAPAYAVLAALMIVVLIVAVLGGPIALLAYLAWMRRQGRIGCDKQTSSSLSSSSSSALHAYSVAHQLTTSYKPAFWYWTIVILMRRLFLIIILTFVSESTFGLVTFANYSFLAVHLLAWPYKNVVDSWLEALTLAALSAQTLLLNSYPNAQLRPASASVLLLLLLILPAVVVVATGIGSLLWRYRKWRLRQVLQAVWTAPPRLWRVRSQYFTLAPSPREADSAENDEL